MADLLGVDFVHHPELALKSTTRTNIMFIGMIKGFVHRQVSSRLLGKTKEDWVNARRIINGWIKLRR